MLCAYRRALHGRKRLNKCINQSGEEVFHYCSVKLGLIIDGSREPRPAGPSSDQDPALHPAFSQADIAAELGGKCSFCPASAGRPSPALPRWQLLLLILSHFPSFRLIILQYATPPQISMPSGFLSNHRAILIYCRWWPPVQCGRRSQLIPSAGQTTEWSSLFIYCSNIHKEI